MLRPWMKVESVCMLYAPTMDESWKSKIDNGAIQTRSMPAPSLHFWRHLSHCKNAKPI